MKEEDTRLLIGAKLALDTNDTKRIKEALEELIDRYKTTVQRYKKVLEIGDKEQEALILLNEKLIHDREELSNNIHNILQDQKCRAKNILTTRRAIYESHKKELIAYKTSYDKLQTVLAEKESLSYRYAMLQQDYQEVKKSVKPEKADVKPQNEQQTSKPSNTQKVNKNELEDILETLKSQGLEEEIFTRTQNFVDMQILNGQMDSIIFAKRFFKMLKIALEKGFLKKYLAQDNAEQVSVYILKNYTQDILSVVADMIIQFAADKHQRAVEFLSSFDGSVGHDVDGTAVQRPKIIDERNNLWLSTSIIQNQTQLTSLQKQIEDKQKSVDNINEAMENDKSDIQDYKALIEEYRAKPKKEMNIEEQNDLVRYETLLKQKTLELEMQKKILTTEKGKLQLAKEAISTVSAKHETIVLAFVKSLELSMDKKLLS